jgi:hypothetical protein
MRYLCGGLIHLDYFAVRRSGDADVRFGCEMRY